MINRFDKYIAPITAIMGDMALKQEDSIFKAVQNMNIIVNKEELLLALNYDRKQFEAGYLAALDAVEKLMYQRCMVDDNPESLQKWESGCWIRFKLFENVMREIRQV